MENEAEIKKRIENAQEFENILPLFTPEERKQLKYGSEEIARKLLEQKGIGNASEKLLARFNWLTYWNTETPEAQKVKKPEPVKRSHLANFLSSIATLAQGVAVGASILRPQKEPEVEIKPSEQPRTRFEQMEQAGRKITEGSAGNDSWGTEEAVSEVPQAPAPVPTPPLQQPLSRIGSRPFVPSATALSAVRNRPRSFRSTGDNNWGSPEKPGRTLAKKGRRLSKIKPKALGKKIASSFLKRYAVAAIVIGVIVLISSIVFIIIMIAAGCYIFNNPIGDLLGINYCNINKSEPAPNPEPIPPGEEYPQPPKGVTIKMTGPGRVENGQNIAYRIKVTYDTREAEVQPQDIRVIDVPKYKHGFVSASGTYQGSGEATVWRLSDNPSAGFPIYTYIFNLILKPTSTNFKAINVSYIDSPGSGGGSQDLYEGANSRPTNNTCGRKYTDIMKAITRDFGISASNFGDPVCSFSDTKLRQLVSSIEKKPENVDFWMDIAKCESPSNGPNGYARSSSAGDNTQGGAWGQFQMRRSFPLPGKAWTRADDRGDVPWQRQVENAIKYNELLESRGRNFDYWGSAYCLCYYPKYKDKSYCADIVKNGRVRNPSTCNNSCTASLGKN